MGAGSDRSDALGKSVSSRLRASKKVSGKAHSTAFSNIDAFSHSGRAHGKSQLRREPFFRCFQVVRGRPGVGSLDLAEQGCESGKLPTLRTSPDERLFGMAVFRRNGVL